MRNLGRKGFGWALGGSALVIADRAMCEAVEAFDHRNGTKFLACVRTGTDFDEWWMMREMTDDEWLRYQSATAVFGLAVHAMIGAVVFKAGWAAAQFLSRR